MIRGASRRPLAWMFLVGLGLIGLQWLVAPAPLPPGPAPSAAGLHEDFRAPPHTRRILTDGDVRLHEGEVERLMRQGGHWGRWAAFSWQVDGRDVALVAPGLDGRHHFAPAYLVGYVPYPQVEAWVPLATLARRKRYRFDHESHGGEEVWQTSREAFHLQEGDCEDHAIALADWLIGLGHEARVAVGTWRGGGHAWVVLFEGGRTYVLESTHKRPTRAMPLAATRTDYHPTAMFDREHYWVNTGPALTTDYGSPAWERRSRFRRD